MWMVTPFSSVEAYHAETEFYKVKGKDVAGDEDVLVTVAIIHLLVGFTRPVTFLRIQND